jgi:hypothetical protein
MLVVNYVVQDKFVLILLKFVGRDGITEARTANYSTNWNTLLSSDQCNPQQFI